MAESSTQTTLSSAIAQKQARKTALLAEKTTLEARIDVIDAAVAALDAEINDLQTTTGSIHEVPTLTALNLVTIILESTGNTLTVTGTGFDAAYTKIAINGTVVTPTTVASATSASCDIDDVLAQTIQTLSITVVNTAPGGGTSAALNLPVVYGAPTLTLLNPDSVVSPAGDTLVTLTGVNFYDDSDVYVNGVLTASSLAGSDLQVTVPGSALATAGIPVSIFVRNPTPGGGSSETLLITVS